MPSESAVVTWGRGPWAGAAHPVTVDDRACRRVGRETGQTPLTSHALLFQRRMGALLTWPGKVRQGAPQQPGARAPLTVPAHPGRAQAATVSVLFRLFVSPCPHPRSWAGRP